MRLNKPRVEPLTESELNDEMKKLITMLARGGKPFNIFMTLARHPKLFSRWLTFGNHILGPTTTLPIRERELVILRVGWLCKAGYEWGHHVDIGTKAGLTPEDIKRVAAGPDAPGWTPFESALLRAAEELHNDSFITDATWKILSEKYSVQQIMDFVFTVGQYKLVSMALNTFGVQLEEGYERMPE